MQLPSALLQSLAGIPGFDETSFTDVHAARMPLTSVRVNGAKGQADSLKEGGLPLAEGVPWTRQGFYLSRRPSFTFDPHFHSGVYYVQEASSMFLEQAVQQAVDLSQPLRVLDLCAAPGGKSTHLQSLLSPDSLLVSNEVIKARAGILKGNIIKWGCQNVVVTNNDPQHIARLESFFDVIVVDAPCSGSGLFRRDETAIEQWSEDAVQLCCGRQKRILADVMPSLKEGGVLIYSTCSYSRDEDEDIADWLVQTIHLQNQRIAIQPEWGIVETVSEKEKAYGYRFFPDKVKGEGFYLALFRKETGSVPSRLKSAKIEKPSAKEIAISQNWLRTPMEFFQYPYIYGIPKNLAEWYGIIKNYLNVQYAGIALGTVMKDKLVPEHALALAANLSPRIPVTDLDYDTAIKYLQRAEITIDTATKGWQAVSYNGYNLGWINALHNRVNNYYPKEFRILKREDDSGFEK